MEDETERGQRVWSVKVATSDDRQFNLSISQDGSSIVANDEDATPDDDIDKLRSAEITVSDAITAAAEEAKGQGDLSSLEIDTDDSGTVVWQVEFGGDSGTTVLVDAASGDIVDVGPDAG
ncbi:PepSY domain-containing protein [Arthrobacter echini]|uniref:PepSY domain-containing protein n=1 Tax=Arthrobacter echini TaxID=1529066 RepID=UPI0021CCB322|nr:PepSY domain-containing protein [Arthrobacter echini]